MIYPFAVGPMSISAFIWFQGESNLGDGDKHYGYAQTAIIHMIVQAVFQGANGLFWIRRAGADVRLGQLASLSLQIVGYAIGTDIGDPTGPFSSIHPRNKKLIGKRLASAALTLAYDTSTTYLPPTYKSSSSAVASTK
jgi:sialate O-acetylesterase